MADDRIAMWGVIAACVLVGGCSIRTAESADVVDAGSLDGPQTTVEPSTTTIEPSTTTTTTLTTTTTEPTTASTRPAPTPRPVTTTIPALTGWAATDAYLERRILGGGSQAASFAVSIGGQIVHRHAMGVRVPDSWDGAEPQDRFRIASISKTITAITMLQLVEDGYIGLDEPVGALVAMSLGIDAPAEGTGDITVRQLLTHSSGFAKYESLFFNAQAGSCREAATVGFTRSLDSPSYRYSNLNFCVLGLLIEALTARPYEQVVYEQLLTPLGLSGMRLAPTYDPGPDEIQHRSVPNRNYMEVLGAAGSWVATPSDIVVILDSLDLATPGWKPLDESTLAAMTTSSNDPLAADRGYGMGLMLFGGGTYGHTGTLESTHTMALARADDVTWALTVSGEYPSSSFDIAKVVDAALFAGGFVEGAPIVVD